MEEYASTSLLARYSFLIFTPFASHMDKIRLFMFHISQETDPEPRSRDLLAADIIVYSSLTAQSSESN